MNTPTSPGADLEGLVRKLREVARTVRTKPVALSTFIPLLNKSADAVEALTAQAAPALDEMLTSYERLSHRAGELWERCQGKGWPAAEPAEFERLRDKLLPELREKLRAALAGTPVVAAPTAQPAGDAGAECLTESEREHIHCAIEMLGDYEAEQRERGNDSIAAGAGATRYVLEKLFRFSYRAHASRLAAPPKHNLTQKEDEVLRNAAARGSTLIAEGRLAAQEVQEPVAEIGSDYMLLWAGQGPIASLVKRHGLKVGDKLFASPSTTRKD